MSASITPAELMQALKQQGIEVSDTPTISAEQGPTTWRAIDLEPVIEGGSVDSGPTMLRRADAEALFYAGKLHALHGEPESGKSFLAQIAAVETMNAARTVVYLDFESGPDEVVGRLRSLGADDAQIALLFRYVRPQEPLSAAAAADLEGALAGEPALAVVDGINEAMTLLGFDPNSNRDAAQFFTAVPRRMATAGAAVVLIDHVAKRSDDRGRWAVGAGHKLGAVDVAYSVEIARAFGRGRSGMSRLVVRKDRAGHVRGIAESGGRVAEFSMEEEGGALSWRLDPPSEQGPFRPTGYMERIAAALSVAGELSGRAIEERVTGKRDYIRQALVLLIAEGYVEAEEQARARRRFTA